MAYEGEASYPRVHNKTTHGGEPKWNIVYTTKTICRVNCGRSSVYTEETTHREDSVQRRVHLEGLHTQKAQVKGKTTRKGDYTWKALCIWRVKTWKGTDLAETIYKRNINGKAEEKVLKKYSANDVKILRYCILCCLGVALAPLGAQAYMALLLHSAKDCQPSFYICRKRILPSDSWEIVSTRSAL